MRIANKIVFVDQQVRDELIRQRVVPFESTNSILRRLLGMPLPEIRRNGWPKGKPRKRTG